MKRALLIAAVAAFFLPSIAHADCLIEGQTIPEGATDPNDPCRICDSGVDGMGYSAVDCSGENFGSCNVGICDPGNGTCVPLALPARTRCSDPKCETGVLTQDECDGNGTCVLEAVTRTCDGFACQNDSTCADTCDAQVPCRMGFDCVNGTCIESVNADMGNPDVGFDMGGDVVQPPDFGPDVPNNNQNNTNNSNNQNNSNNSNNANNQNNGNNTNGPPTTTGGSDGCCSTSGRKNPTVILVMLFAAFGFLRRKSRRTIGRAS